MNANLYEEDDSNNVLLLSNLLLEYDLEETMGKDEKEGSPPELEDVPENDITFLQKLKSFLGIQLDMTVQLATKMMMEGEVKARQKKLTWI